MKSFRSLLILTTMIGVAFSGCVKDPNDGDETPSEEAQQIINYVEENLSNAKFHKKTGIWYEMIEEGTWEENDYEYKIDDEGYLEFPRVNVNYVGRLLDGTVFNDYEDQTFQLGGLIVAWQFMFVPQVIDDFEVGGITETGLLKGAKVRFVTPSSRAYGAKQWGDIPPNSPLDFTVEVLDLLDPQ